MVSVNDSLELSWQFLGETGNVAVGNKASERDLAHRRDICLSMRCNRFTSRRTL